MSLFVSLSFQDSNLSFVSSIQFSNFMKKMPNRTNQNHFTLEQKKKNKKMQDFKVGEPLAKGYSGHVYLGTNTKTNKKVCIKIMSIDDPKQIKHVREQVKKKKKKKKLNIKVEKIEKFRSSKCS